MSSSNFSEELLDVIEAMIVNAGGTVPPLREMNFNDRLLTLLGALAPFVGTGGGGGGGGGSATLLNGQAGSFYVDRANHTGQQAIGTVTGLFAALGDKLSKTTAETIAARHTINPATAGAPFVLGANATGKVVNLDSDRLDGMDSGDLLNRANHTGNAPISSVTGLQTALDGKVSNSDLSDRLSKSTPDIITARHTINPATAGAPFVLGANAQEKVVGLDADRLDGLDSSALLNRANHSGTQPISSITNLQPTLDDKLSRNTAETVTARHTFNPSSAGAPFILGANATGKVINLDADRLDGFDSTHFLNRANHVGAVQRESHQYLSLVLGGVSSIGNNTNVIIPWTERADLNNWFDPANPSQLLLPVGLYLVFFDFRYAASSTAGARGVRIGTLFGGFQLVNSFELPAVTIGTAVSGNHAVNGSFLYEAAVPNGFSVPFTLQLAAFQTSGASLNLAAASLMIVAL